MAEVHTAKTPSLSEQYLLKEKEEKLDSGLQPAEELEVKIDASATTEEVVTPKTEENSVTVGSDEGKPAAADESASASSVTAGESTEAIISAGENSVAEDTQVAAEESTVSAEQEDSGDQEVEETPEVKLETAPADFRFPTTNQTRHCFTRYIEYHRCVAAKGEGAPECDKFAKYYRSLCPGEWIDRWNEQRENGTFPGPL
ncbi:cytochrome c oxidase subunit 6b-1-like isoform X1 [Diospyros lotus]|uniref:cytochrome c oxidase subunit 6b-1-like isoform X1 n=1 Tax=Diospyros lotus TaxID=55363 RepID=UPI002254B155|nr:cytochrome c oxidase subunit 6b-1-like isoform X1 [Diospyros lotus]